MRDAIVIERAGANVAAPVPDLPGCVATGGSIGDVEEQIRAAIACHVQGLREDGVAVPLPSSQVEHVDVAA
jgi:predicted RNase H-like HicB family nuclease